MLRYVDKVPVTSAALSAHSLQPEASEAGMSAYLQCYRTGHIEAHRLHPTTFRSSDDEPPSGVTLDPDQVVGLRPVQAHIQWSWLPVLGIVGKFLGIPPPSWLNHTRLATKKICTSSARLPEPRCVPRNPAFRFMTSPSPAQHFRPAFPKHITCACVCVGSKRIKRMRCDSLCGTTYTKNISG